MLRARRFAAGAMWAAAGTNGCACWAAGVLRASGCASCGLLGCCGDMGVLIGLPGVLQARRCAGWGLLGCHGKRVCCRRACVQSIQTSQARADAVKTAVVHLQCAVSLLRLAAPTRIATVLPLLQPRGSRCAMAASTCCTAPIGTAACRCGSVTRASSHTAAWGLASCCRQPPSLEQVGMLSRAAGRCYRLRGGFLGCGAVLRAAGRPWLCTEGHGSAACLWPPLRPFSAAALALCSPHHARACRGALARPGRAAAAAAGQLAACSVCLGPYEF